MTRPLTDDQLDTLAKHALTPHRQVSLPTRQLRELINEVYELRDQNSVLRMQVDGSRAIVDAITAAARTDVDTKLSAIQIERRHGPPFYLIEAISDVRGT